MAQKRPHSDNLLINVYMGKVKLFFVAVVCMALVSCQVNMQKEAEDYCTKNVQGITSLYISKPFALADDVKGVEPAEQAAVRLFSKKAWNYLRTQTFDYMAFLSLRQVDEIVKDKGGYYVIVAFGETDKPNRYIVNRFEISRKDFCYVFLFDKGKKAISRYPVDGLVSQEIKNKAEDVELTKVK